MNDIILKCKNLTKIYKVKKRQILALNHISFEIKKGIVFGIIGPNGSGKTTLFKILMGMIKRFDGEFEILGSRNGKNIKVKEKIGFLPEQPAIYPDLNAYEALKFYASFFNDKNISRKDYIYDLIKQVGLYEHRKKKVREYSKGMMQRLSIAQAIINNPDLLILDELTSGLDPFVTEEINEIILNLKKQGKTIVISSHLLGHIQDISDVIGVLYKGKLLKIGTIKEITQVKEKGVAVFDTMGKTIQECASLFKNTPLPVTSVDYLENDLEAAFKQIVNEEIENEKNS